MAGSMAEIATGVLKKSTVHVSEPCRIGGQAGRHVTNKHAATGSATARLVEQNDQRAVIEVVCGCGQTLHVECNYPAAAE